MTGLRTVRLTNAYPHRPPIRTTPTLASKLVCSQRQASTAFRTNAVQDRRSQAFVRTTWALHTQRQILRKHAFVLLLFKNRVRYKTMIWEARHAPFEPRTPFKAGISLPASRSGLFAEVLKRVKSRARLDSIKGRMYQALAFGGHGCRFSDTNCKRRRFGFRWV